MWDTLVLTSFVAPSLGSVFALLVADIVTRLIHYEFAWKSIIKDNQQEWTFQFIAYAYGTFLLFEIFFFIILQKSQLAQYFSFNDLEKKQSQMTNAFNAQSDAVIIVDHESSFI